MNETPTSTVWGSSHSSGMIHARLIERPAAAALDEPVVDLEPRAR